MKVRSLVCHILLLTCLVNTSCGQTRAINDTTPRAKDIPSLDTGMRNFKFIPGNFINLEVDVLDNIYLVTAGNQLKKYGPAGDSLAVYNDVKKFGNPGMIDVNNPLKILVYYPNYATVTILDRLLTVRNSINFRKQQIFAVKALTTSYDNNIWLYDEQDMKLKKIDDDGKVLAETTDWRLLFQEAPSPSTIIDRDNFVYLYDVNKGFYIFDYYGSFRNNLPFTGWQHVAVSKDNLYGFSDNKLFSYALKSLNIKTYMLPASVRGASDIRAMNGKLYVLKKEGLEIFTLL